MSAERTDLPPPGYIHNEVDRGEAPPTSFYYPSDDSRRSEESDIVGPSPTPKDDASRRSCDEIFIAERSGNSYCDRSFSNTDTGHYDG